MKNIKIIRIISRFVKSSDKTQKCVIILSFFQTSSHLKEHMKIHRGQAKTVLMSEPVNPVQPQSLPVLGEVK